jgi:hypothetical protein
MVDGTRRNYDPIFVESTVENLRWGGVHRGEKKMGVPWPLGWTCFVEKIWLGVPGVVGWVRWLEAPTAVLMKVSRLPYFLDRIRFIEKLLRVAWSGV